MHTARRDLFFLSPGGLWQRRLPANLWELLESYPPLGFCCVKDRDKDRDGREEEKNGRENALHLPPQLSNSIPSCTIWKT